MGATSDNYDIVTSGTTYTIASDYVKPSGGETAHFQMVKLAYGANDSVFYTSASSPLPVGLCGAWGRYEYTAPSGYYSLTTTIVGITGTSLTVMGVSGGEPVGITVGTIAIASGSTININKLNGGTIGDASGTTAGIDYVGVQGISGAYPVGVTFASPLSVSLSTSSNIGIFGVSGATAIGVTFSTISIRGLTAASDTVTVFGGGTASTVSVGLFGFTGATAEPLYAENNALNVNIKTAPGITVTAADLDIRNLDYTADTVTIVGQGASDNASSPKATVPTYINALGIGGNLLQVGGVTGAGWSAAALNVNLVNSGITFTVSASATFSADVGITAQYNGAIPVQGSTQAGYGVWVTGSTSGDPVSVKIDGISGSTLPVVVQDFTTQTNSINNTINDVKINTAFLAAMKKALYSDAVSVGSGDFSDKYSLYTLVRDSVGNALSNLTDTIVLDGGALTNKDSLAVSVVNVKQQSAFMARTGFANVAGKSLKDFNGGAGYTCATGVRIKTARVASGASASSNQFMCVISQADADSYGASAGAYSYVLYHGEEMFFDVNNIDKIRVFYPPYSAGFAPNNTASGMTFSFHAS